MTYLTESMQASRKRSYEKQLKKLAEGWKNDNIKRFKYQKKEAEDFLKDNEPPKRKKPLKQAIPSKSRDNASNADRISRKPIQTKRRTPIKKVSDKRAAQNKEYLKIRKQYLKEHPLCAFHQSHPATEIHHRAGKTGKLLTDSQYFLPVCRDAHIFIENNPTLAYEKGWSLKRLAK